MTAAAAAPPPRREPAAPRSLAAGHGRERGRGVRLPGGVHRSPAMAGGEASLGPAGCRPLVTLGPCPRPGSRRSPRTAERAARSRGAAPPSGSNSKPWLFVGSCGLLFLESIVATCRNLSVQYRHRPLLAIQIKGWLGCPPVIKSYNFLPSCKLLL